MSTVATFALCQLLGGIGVGASPARDAGENVVSTTAGIDGSSLVWSLGYARVFTLAKERRLLIGTQFGLPMAQPDFGDWRWATGARIDLLRRGRFAWPLELDVIARRLQNASVSAFGLGTEVATMPGWYPERWFVAAEVAWDQQWATRLVHSDAYREYIYPEVRDGWYGTPGITARYGGRVGGRPWQHMELWLRAGYEQHGRYDTFAPPAYALVGLNFSF